MRIFGNEGRKTARRQVVLFKGGAIQDEYHRTSCAFRYSRCQVNHRTSHTLVSHIILPFTSIFAVIPITRRPTGNPQDYPGSSILAPFSHYTPETEKKTRKRKTDAEKFPYPKAAGTSNPIHPRRIPSSTELSSCPRRSPSWTAYRNKSPLWGWPFLVRTPTGNARILQAGILSPALLPRRPRDPTAGGNGEPWGTRDVRGSGTSMNRLAIIDQR